MSVPNTCTRHHQEAIKLHNIDVPIFKGDLMEWQIFWEQYDISIHSRTQLSDPVKLAYLRQVLRMDLLDIPLRVCYM